MLLGFALAVFVAFVMCINRCGRCDAFFVDPLQQLTLESKRIGTD